MSSKTPADTASLQTRLERGFERAVTPFQAFIAEQTTTSIALIICTVLALALANSPLAHDYEALFETTLGVVYSDWSLIMPLRHWINEGLMALFFFLLGLEIKRELLVGELNAGRRAITVIAAALGGMLVPATIFFMLNAGGEFAHGWGIPMATDTAFAVGILALLDKRIPSAALTFLVALAIIDDLGAILVIAVFYSDGTSVARLAVAAGILLALIACNALGIRRPAIYVLGGVLVWAALLGSGVHATVAGVLVAATVPARPKRHPGWFLQRTRRLVSRFQRIENDSTQSQPMLGQEEQHLIAEDVREAAELATTPLRRWEHALEHPVALLVLPVFALANAGITVDIDTAATLWTDTLVIGIVLGLVVGKGLGIPLLTWLVTRLKLGELPPDVNMRHIVGVGLLGGMGFTMSIFIARLGFNTEPEAMQAAKIGILLASLIAGLAGYCWLRLCCKR
jgi:NhaA family Na+:H+ antiporter